MPEDMPVSQRSILTWKYPSDTFDPWWIYMARERNWITDEQMDRLMCEEYYAPICS